MTRKAATNKWLSFLKNVIVVLAPIGIIGGAARAVFNGNTNQTLYVILSVIFTCFAIYIAWLEIRLRSLEGK